MWFAGSRAPGTPGERFADDEGDDRVTSQPRRGVGVRSPREGEVQRRRLLQLPYACPEGPLQPRSPEAPGRSDSTASLTSLASVQFLSPKSAVAGRWKELFGSGTTPGSGPCRRPPRRQRTAPTVPEPPPRPRHCSYPGPPRLMPGLPARPRPTCEALTAPQVSETPGRWGRARRPLDQLPLAPDLLRAVNLRTPREKAARTVSRTRVHRHPRRASATPSRSAARRRRLRVDQGAVLGVELFHASSCSITCGPLRQGAPGAWGSGSCTARRLCPCRRNSRPYGAHAHDPPRPKALTAAFSSRFTASPRFGLLQTHAAGLEQDHGPYGLPSVAIP